MAKAKAKTMLRKKEASRKKHPASPTRPKGPRGNHAIVISGPPPTPPKRKGKSKCKQVDSDAEDDSEPPKKKKKDSKKASTQSKKPQCTSAKSADPNPLESDQCSCRPTSGGTHERQNAAHPSAPCSSSPSPSGNASSSSRAPRSSSAASAPPSDNTASSAPTAPSRSSDNHASSGVASSQRPSQKPPPSSHSTVPPPPIAPDAFENAVKTFKALPAVTDDDGDLGDLGSKKMSISKLFVEEMDGEDGGEGKEDEDEEDEDGEGEEEDGETGGDDDDADADDDVEEEDSDDDDVEEELSKAEVDSFLALIRSRKDDKYALTQDESKEETVPGHFKKWARHAHRICGVYTDIHGVITTGMTVVKANPKTAADYQECYKHMPNMTAKAAQFYTKRFFHLCDYVPKFKLLCQHLLSRPRGMFHVAKFFQNHAGAGRSTDIATLKRDFHSYLPTVTLANGNFIPPLSKNQYVNLKSRNARYYSDCSARLILPINERDAFDKEPHEYAKRKNVQCKERERVAARPRKHHKNDHPKHADGAIDDEKTFPSFLFPTIQTYDAKNPQRGIFKGDLCLTAARHLFKGPSSVGRNDGLPGFGCLCLAGLYEIKHFTPDLLAYVATLVRHLLSIDAHWQKESAERRGHHFHTALHTILSVDYDAWKEDRDHADTDDMDEDSDNDMDEADKNIFSYYNRRIFRSPWGDPETQVVTKFDLEDTDNEDNLRVRMLAARKAELAGCHLPRPKKGKQHASSEDLRAFEQPEPLTRDTSVEFIEGLQPSDPVDGSTEDDAGAGDGSDNRMSDK